MWESRQQCYVSDLRHLDTLVAAGVVPAATVLSLTAHNWAASLRPYAEHGPSLEGVSVAEMVVGGRALPLVVQGTALHRSRRWLSHLYALHAFVTEHGRQPFKSESALLVDQVGEGPCYAGVTGVQSGHEPAGLRGGRGADAGVPYESRPPTGRDAGSETVNLGEWLKAMRPGAARGTLGADKEALLDALSGGPAGWRVSQGARDNHARWMQWLASTAAFVRLRGRLPKARDALDAGVGDVPAAQPAGGGGHAPAGAGHAGAESALKVGSWLQNQRVKSARAALSEPQVHLLDAHLPGWSAAAKRTPVTGTPQPRSQDEPTPYRRWLREA